MVSVKTKLEFSGSCRSRWAAAQAPSLCRSAGLQPLQLVHRLCLSILSEL